MKKAYFFILIALMVLNIVGCNKEPQGESPTVNNIEYEVLEYRDLSEKQMDIVDTMKKERGYINFTEEDYNIVVISSGEKNTGGYSIEVISVEDVEGTAKIKVIEKSPQKGSDVTQALTYPIIILELPVEVQGLKVVNDKGEEFKEIYLEDVKITALGTYVGQIDNNFIEVKIDGKPNVFMVNEESREKIQNLKDNSEVEMVYYHNEFGQFVLTDIELIEYDSGFSTLEGKYVGQIDPTSIEVIVDDEPYVLVSYNMERILEGIGEGDRIRVQYTKEKERFMIEKIEKVN